MTLLTPLIPQRADPQVYRHTDGYYYFTASVPEYNRIELRRSSTIAGLATAKTVDVWHKPETGPMSELIWAPEIHFNQGAWYVYFAAAPSREIKDNLFQHRVYAIRCADANPLEGTWDAPVRIETGIDRFCLDATTFTHKGQLYYVWAQKEPEVAGNSNICIAKMDTPVKLATRAVRLSIPELEWEIRGFLVNEGPAVLVRNGKVFISYSASATDENYCVGLLHADQDADLLDPASWTKAKSPLLTTCREHKVFGPGHNSFTVSEDGKTDMLVFHARTYTEIIGDPLWNPDRHTWVKPIKWDANGMPVFGCSATVE